MRSAVIGLPRGSCRYEQPRWDWLRSRRTSASSLRLNTASRLVEPCLSRCVGRVLLRRDESARPAQTLRLDRTKLASAGLRNLLASTRCVNPTSSSPRPALRAPHLLAKWRCPRLRDSRRRPTHPSLCGDSRRPEVRHSPTPPPVGPLHCARPVKDRVLARSGWVGETITPFATPPTAMLP